MLADYSLSARVSFRIFEKILPVSLYSEGRFLLCPKTGAAETRLTHKVWAQTSAALLQTVLDQIKNLKFFIKMRKDTLRLQLISNSQIPQTAYTARANCSLRQQNRSEGHLSFKFCALSFTLFNQIPRSDTKGLGNM